MSKYRVCLTLSIFQLVAIVLTLSTQDAHSQSKVNAEKQKILRPTSLPVPLGNRQQPKAATVVVPQLTSVTPVAAECPEACKTVTITCGTPPNPVNPPSEAPTGYEDSSLGLTNDSLATCGDRMFVQRGGDGTCKLCVGNGAFYAFIKEPPYNLCGQTMSVEEFVDKYNRFRNGLVNLDLNQVLGKLTGTDLLQAIHDFYVLAQEMCVVADELYHLVNRYSCYHHVACDEAQSTKNSFDCQNNPAVLAFIGRLLSYLDNPLLFPGLESDRVALKKSLIDSYCSTFARALFSKQIENCLCCSTRDGTPAVTESDCADCAALYCPRGGSPKTISGISTGEFPSFCAGFDQTAAKKNICDWFLTQTGPHTCNRFMVAPVQNLRPSLSSMTSNPAMSPTGGLNCSVAPVPVPTCVEGPNGGVETICLTAPPISG